MPGGCHVARAGSLAEPAERLGRQTPLCSGCWQTETLARCCCCWVLVAYFALCGACRYHQYKFIVDGEWRHDETQPFMPDPLGNVNNWLFVRKPDGSGNTTPTAATAAAAGSGGGLGGPSLVVAQQQRQQPQQQHLHQAQALHPAQQAVGDGLGAAAAAGLGAGGAGASSGGHHLSHRAGGGAGTAPSSRSQSVADMDVSVAGLPPGEPSVPADGGVIAPIALQADEPGGLGWWWGSGRSCLRSLAGGVCASPHTPSGPLAGTVARV